MDGALAQELVREHWDLQPCDSELSAREPHSRDFYLDVERQRYALQPHILECHSWIDWRGKRVLEIGAGIGTDARLLGRLQPAGLRRLPGRRWGWHRILHARKPCSARLTRSTRARS